MEYRQLGTSDLEVPAIIFGAWAVGGWYWGPQDDAESIRTIHAAIDAGITCIDTAPMYGMGHSEEVVGKATKGRRDRKLAEGREARRLRRARVRQRGDFIHDLTLGEEVRMLHPAAQTDAGPAGEHPARDSRPGRRRTRQRGHPGPAYASERSRLPQASECLIPQGALSSSR